MLLRLGSGGGFSLLRGSFGSLRFFSEGTSLARGWRWPIGASRGIADGFAAPGDPVLLPVVAIAAGAPTRASSAMVGINFAVNNFRILLLPFQRNASIAPDRESRSLHNSGAPGRRSPAPFVYRPWCRATRFPPSPARQRNQASPHSRRCDCPGRPAAPALPFPRLSSIQSRIRRIEMNVTAIIHDTIARFLAPFTFSGKRICVRQVIRADRRLAVATGNIEHVIGLA